MIRVVILVAVSSESQAADAERQRDTMQRILSQRDELLGVLQHLPDMLRNRTPKKITAFCAAS